MSTKPLSNGVYQIGSGMVNSYVIDGDEGVTLVDTLVPNREGVITESLKENRPHPRRCQSDPAHPLSQRPFGKRCGHQGGFRGPRLRSRGGHTCDSGNCEAAEPSCPRYYRPLFGLAVLFPDAPPVDVDHFVAESPSELLPGDLRAIDTAGHTPGHTSYLLDRDGGTSSGGGCGLVY